ncbi:hypothetical protein WG66_008957 [Moniliophthora roreri]|nr:hypothetical protein WG66_008957 [Moniliophthora roreri]
MTSHFIPSLFLTTTTSYIQSSPSLFHCLTLLPTVCVVSSSSYGRFSWDLPGQYLSTLIFNWASFLFSTSGSLASQQLNVGGSQSSLNI